MRTRPIPSTGEPLPVIGCGTYRGFDVTNRSAAYRQLPAVLEALFQAGGSVIDSSPMYGRAEAVSGDLLAGVGTRSRAFLATKVWTRGREAGLRQIRDSLSLLQTDVIDLLQIHNLLDWRAHLPALKQSQAEGRVRYIGVTHHTPTAYKELETVLRAERWDFVQLNYSLEDRCAEARLLPLAQERGIAVIANLPLGGGSLMNSLRGRALPSWAHEIGCESWSQVLLRFVVSHPAITCAIPGTGNPEHMADNARAGAEGLPDDRVRAIILREWDGR